MRTTPAREASAGSRSSCPSDQRYSIRICLPSTKPACSSAPAQAGKVFRERVCGKPINRPRRLPRPRGERPSGYTAADKCDEVPPPHGAYPKAKDHGPSIADVRAVRGRASQQKRPAVFLQRTAGPYIRVSNGLTRSKPEAILCPLRPKSGHSDSRCGMSALCRFCCRSRRKRGQLRLGAELEP